MAEDTTMPVTLNELERRMEHVDGKGGALERLFQTLDKLNETMAGVLKMLELWHRPENCPEMMLMKERVSMIETNQKERQSQHESTRAEDNKRVDAEIESLNKKFDKFERKLDKLQTTIAWASGGLAVVITIIWPIVKELLLPLFFAKGGTP